MDKDQDGDQDRDQDRPSFLLTPWRKVNKEILTMIQHASARCCIPVVMTSGPRHLALDSKL